MTHAKAVETLRALMASVPPPRVIYAEPDGREQMHNPRLERRLALRSQTPTIAEWAKRHGRIA